MDASNLRFKKFPYWPGFVFLVLSGDESQGKIDLGSAAARIIVAPDAKEALDKWNYAARRSAKEFPWLCVSLFDLRALRKRALDSTWVDGISRKLARVTAKEADGREPWIVSHKPIHSKPGRGLAEPTTVLASSIEDIEAWAIDTQRELASAMPIAAVDELISTMQKAANGDPSVRAL